ncbi:diacylglycerol kinase [Clostridia bacterium]|nr:diacylglycerol kinase [Clostridia bacterium]
MSKRNMRHFFVINPKSFITAKDWRTFLLSVERCFSVGKRAEYKTYISRFPRDAIAAVRRYIASVPPEETVRVYAVGGDGILFDCLNGIVNYPNAELASVPYGNANDFVRAFGEGHADKFRDIKALSTAPTILTDILQCGVNYAISNCSLGLEAAAVIRMNWLSRILSKMHNRRKLIPLLYKFGAVVHLLDRGRFIQEYEVTLDGENLSGRYVNINVGNIFGNGGSNSPSPYALPDDGIANVIFLNATSAPKVVSIISDYCSGGYERHPKSFFAKEFKEMRVKSREPMYVVLDGESFFSRDFSMKILPKAVKIVAPPGLTYVRREER